MEALHTVPIVTRPRSKQRCMVYFQYLLRGIIKRFPHSRSSFHYPLLLSVPSYTQDANNKMSTCPVPFEKGSSPSFTVIKERHALHRFLPNCKASCVIDSKLVLTKRQHFSVEVLLKGSPHNSTQNIPVLETVGKLPGNQRAPVREWNGMFSLMPTTAGTKYSTYK